MEYRIFGGVRRRARCLCAGFELVGVGNEGLVGCCEAVHGSVLLFVVGG